MLDKDDVNISKARHKKREHIVEAALALIGQKSTDNFDPVHSPICAIDVVMVAGAPWLKDALERDYLKDESGYKKIGGGANSPKKGYFFRSATNLIHFLKRQGLYAPRGANPTPKAGMVCFLDWDDRGRFNFAPDRSAIVMAVHDKQITKIVLCESADIDGKKIHSVVQKKVLENSKLDRAIIGYSDLP